MKNRKKLMMIALLCTTITGAVFFSACDSSSETTVSNTSSSQVSIVSAEKSESAVEFSSEDINTDYDTENAVSVKLSGSSADITGNGAVLDGNIIRISAAGTYILSGTMDDGQIVISAGKDDTVQLVLDNVSVTAKTTPALYAEQCGKTILLLADGSENTFSDGNSDTTDSEDEKSPNAAVFCQDDLTIVGNGSLTVNGNANNGITSKDTLRIASGTVTVNAAHHGITGKDNIAIEGGTVSVTAQTGDGIRSTYSDTDKDDKGHVFIQNASITVLSGKDAIQAEKNLTINSGTFDITTGDGAKETSSDNGFDMRGGFNFNNNDSSSEDTDSLKALKAGNNIIINGGTFHINAYDDALHSNGDVTVTGGAFHIQSGDDGIHADNTLTIKNGEITVSQSYEGLEGTVIEISGGNIDITASDDGINAAGGNDNSGFGNFDGGRGFGRFEGRQFDLQNNDNTPTAQQTVAQTETDNSSLSPALNISGGTVCVTAQGDGLDSNSALNISGGTIIVNGTTQGGNGILDHDGTMTVTGGTIIGAGTYDMLEMPSDSSSQKSVAVMFGSAQSAGTLVYITDSKGSVMAAMSPEKSFSCIVFSSPELKDGETYTVYTGGTASGEDTHGYYTNASITGGTQYTAFTASDTVSYVNESGNTSYSGMGGGMMGGRGSKENWGGMNPRDFENMTPPDDNGMTPPDFENITPPDRI